MIRFYILIFSLLALLSCTDTLNKKTTHCSISITDSYSRNVVLDSVPSRVVSLAPGITEILFAIGEGSKLVGRTDYCKFPAEVSSIASIGGLENPNIEAIAKLNPDLVIASTHFRKETLGQIEQLKIPIIVEKGQESFEGAYELISRVSAVFRVQAKGDSLVRSMKSRVQAVAQSVKLVTIKPKVYVVIGFGKTGDYTAGGNTFINDMITMAGGLNIASDIEGWSFSLEKLVERDPDIIIIRPGDKIAFCQLSNYKNLRAVKTGKVYEVDNNLIELTGPRLVEGLEVLNKIFHP
jgi:iron complex transport system substrate-binding protein